MSSPMSPYGTRFPADLPDDTPVDPGQFVAHNYDWFRNPTRDRPTLHREAVAKWTYLARLHGHDVDVVPLEPNEIDYGIDRDFSHVGRVLVDAVEYDLFLGQDYRMTTLAKLGGDGRREGVERDRVMPPLVFAARRPDWYTPVQPHLPDELAAALNADSGPGTPSAIADAVRQPGPMGPEWDVTNLIARAAELAYHWPRRRRFGPFDPLPDDVGRLLVQHFNTLTQQPTGLREWQRDRTWPVDPAARADVDQSCWRPVGEVVYSDPWWKGTAGRTGRLLLSNSLGAVELHPGETPLDALAPPLPVDDVDREAADLDEVGR